MKKLLTLAALSLLFSCTRPELFDIVKLGSVQSDVILPDTAPGEGRFDIVSDRAYSAYLSTGTEWCALESVEPDKILFSFTGNNGFRRSAKVIIQSGSRKDSMLVKQPGVKEEYIRLSSTVVSGPSEGGSFSLEVSSNLIPRMLNLEISNDKCLKNVTLKNNVLSFDLAPSTNWDRRTYKIAVYSINGWGERLASTVSIIQQPKK